MGEGQGVMELRRLAERSAVHLQRVCGVSEAWVARWAALSEGARSERRQELDSWLALYLDARMLLGQPAPDEARALDLATHWPGALLRYAEEGS